MNRKKRRVAGAFAIETVISLTVFMIAILALMMGSMLIRAQAMMQYALNQTAKEMSGYFYLLDKVGIASIISGKETDTAASNVQVLNDSIDSIVSFSGGMSEDLEEMVQNGKEIAENAKNGCLTEKDIERIKNFPKQGKEMEEACKKEAEDMKSYLESIKKDKKLIFQGVLQVFGKTLINTGLSKYVTPVVCEFLMPKYLTEGDPEVFYKATGIKENTINFDGSKMLEDGRTISLVVTYKVDASKLTLGFYKKEIQFHQVACTSAWVRKNDSGSLVSLSDVASYFDVARKETQAEYLHALKAAADKQREEDERLEQEFKDMLETHEADETEEKKDDDKDDKGEKKEIKLPDGAVGTASFMEAYNKLSDRDKELYNNLHLLLKKSNIDLTEAINGCSDKDAALQLVLKYKETGGKFLVYQGNDGLKAYLQLDPSCRILLIQGGVKPNSPEARKLIDLILNEKRKKITEADIQAILKGNDKKDDEDKKEETEEEKQDETKPKMSAAATAFLEKYPECQDLYDAYGEEFIKAVTKCGSQKDAIKAIRRAGGAAVTALNAVSEAKTADCIAAIIKYNGAAPVITKYGDDALDAIAKAGNREDAQAAVDVIAERGQYAIDAFKKATPTKECIELVSVYGKAASDVFKVYGDDAVNAVSKLESDQRKAFEMIGEYKEDAIKAIELGNAQKNGAGVVEALGVCGQDAIDAFEFVEPTKSCTKLMVDYGKDVAAVAVSYGDEGIHALEKLDHPQYGIILIQEQGELAVDVTNTYGNRAVEAATRICGQSNKSDQRAALKDIKAQGESVIADVEKINSWTYAPRYKVYRLNKDVYDNSTYYDQETGAVHWPVNNGADGKWETVVLPEGTVIDRYGTDYGDFVSPYTEGNPIPYEQRSLQPDSEYKPYSVFVTTKPITVQKSKIAKYFGQPGGGEQYKLDQTVSQLLDSKTIKKIDSKSRGPIEPPDPD